MKRERSAAYPIVELATAYRILRQELADLGTAELDRDELAKRLGYQAALGGLVARKIGALVQYGLLNRRAGRYGLSPLGLRLRRLDLGHAEFSPAIRAALEHPPLFRAILDRYRESGRVPKNLSGEMVHFGITERASEDAAQVFRDSALFAGILDTNGFFRKNHERVSSGTSAEEGAPIDGSPKNEALALGEWIEIPLLLANEKQGGLRLPRPMEQRDLIALKEAFLQVYRLLPTYLGIEMPPQGGGTEAETKAETSRSPLPFPRR